MEDLSNRLASLSPAQRALLELRLRKNRPAARPTIPHRPPAEHYPLSWDQERLWFIQQLDPDSSAYNIYSVRRFKGTVNAGLVVRCLNEVVRRHEILRTAFVAEDGRPVQLIAPRLNVAVPVIDLRGMSVAGREAEAARIVTELLQRPFDLARLPVFRTALVRLDDDDYVCPTVFHHIVIDWVSFQLFERELAALYAAYHAGKPSPLPELPLQYADFAVWQRQWVDEQEGSEHLDYWRRKLADVPLVLELPTDRPRPEVQGSSGVRQPLVLSKTHSDAVRSLARQEGVTMFICLLAVFKALLFRYTGQEKLIVGSPAAYRKGETEELLGYFLNHLAFCTDLSGDPTFRELLGRVRETAVEAFTHQDVPFGKLVETLQPQRSLSRTPITQVVFLFLNTHQQDEVTFPGFEVLPYWADSGSVDFDMTLSLWDDEAGLNGWLEYNTDLFDSATIIRMTGHFRNLVAAFTADPDRPLSQVPMVSRPEAHQLLVEWSAPARADEAAADLVEAFEAQAARTPDALAVIAGDVRLTYGELNWRANRLAHHLLRLGVGPEAPVGLSAVRSAETLVGLLGVLKAGGVYLPLDPGYPPERLAFMLRDVGASVLLTPERVGWDLPPRCVELLYPAAELDATGEQNPVRRVSGQNLAYLIYTSGSTGEPKGVGITREAAARHIHYAAELYGLRPDDGVLQFTPLSFDAALEQVCAALLSGARLLLRGGELWSPVEFVEHVRRERLTVVDLPPTYWQELLDSLDAEAGSALAAQLRLVIVGGDLMPPLSLSRWSDTPLRAVRLLNAYGPTEATITALCHEVRPGLHRVPQPQRIPVGRPLAGRSVHILDRRGRASAIGVIGELHIGGRLLARGYSHRPGLTAERFIPDPFGGEPGARLYATGDLARYLPNGSVEFVGRRDQQVKVRGHRVELGEIEAALRAHPDVREAVVVAREETPGGKRLVAYLATAQPGLSSDALRSYLRAKMPDFMLPDVFITLAELPRTAAGKVDRRALPPAAAALPGGESFAPPRTPTERTLAAIWCQVLGVAEVGIHDNFFALGGNSIHSIQIVTRAERESIRLTPKQIFQHQSIAELAGVVDAPAPAEAARRTEGATTAIRRRPPGEGSPDPQRFQGPQVLPLRPAPKGGPLRATPAQEQLWALDRLLPGLPVFNIYMTIHLSGALDLNAFSWGLKEVVRRHEILRTTFAAEEGRPVLVVSPSGTVPMLIVDLAELPRSAQEGELLRLAAAEARRPFDLAAGPLLRLTLLRLGATEHRLMFTMHHIISDAWSIGVLVNELTQLYKAFYERRPSPLPELPVQYGDFAYWQHEWLQTGAMQEQLDYWLDKLGGQPSPLNLPTDYPRPDTLSFRTAQERLNVPSELSAALKEFSSREGVSLFMLMLAAFKALLYGYTGREEIRIGTLAANRSHVETERLIGLFVNTLVIRTHLARGLTYRQLLHRVRETVLEAFDHQDLPFEHLLQALEGEPDPERAPLFEVLFLMQNAPVPSVDMPGLALADDGGTPFESNFTMTTFDLILVVTERPDGLCVLLNYKSDIFRAGTISRMLEDFRAVLERMVSQPEEQLAAVRQ